jgi:hypothetical protein
MTCRERSDLFTVTRALPRRSCEWRIHAHTLAQMANKPCGPHANQARGTPTTSFLTATNLMFLRRAGITAAAGTRLALDLILAKGFGLCSFQEHGSKSRALVIPVTASLEEHWAIFVTAATHRSKSRLSGFFSGASPKTPVIHHRQGSPTHYLRNLMEKNHDRLGPQWDHARRCDSPRPEGLVSANASSPPCGGQLVPY